MLRVTNSLVFLFIFLTLGVWSSAQEASPASTPPTGTDWANSVQFPTSVEPSAAFDQVLDQVVERERVFVEQMRHMHPLVETYIQNLKNDREHDVVPASDYYFLSRLDTSNGADRSFMGQPGSGKRILNRLTNIYSMNFLPLGFAEMVMLDEDFQKKYYDFAFVRREFLGEVRCLVIDVQPKEHAGMGRFLGRVWVEDENYNIVRFNGSYSPHRSNLNLHFDSWRLNLRPGVWLPAYIYSEESNLKVRTGQAPHFKAQTRLWDYDPQHLAHNHQEFTQIEVDSVQPVQDLTYSSQDASPIEAERAWESQAEENAVERLQKIGLLAPPGEVDKVLSTVTNNLIIANSLTLPDVRCRVLLTEPLESFTIGRTIVLSRGLIDVLPDEASLAMVLAHELSHIALGHRLDTKLAFNDSLFFPDENTFERLDFTRDTADEEAADQKALALLANSPYKEKLSNAGLFLEALQDRAPELKHLIRPHLGNSLASGKTMRMSALLNTAPQLDMRRIDQIAALPLGGRVRLDPWSNRAELLKTKPLALVSAREKMPFEVTPFLPYLTRLQAVGPDKIAAVPSGQ